MVRLGAVAFTGAWMLHCTGCAAPSRWMRRAFTLDEKEMET
jgi:hypothetical protein